MNYEFNSGTENEIMHVTMPKIETLENGVILEHIERQLQDDNMLGTSDCIAGAPEKDLENWHLQTDMNSCAICCQEFIAEQLLGGDFSEEKMIRYAKDHGWYDPETGTTLKDVGNLLEAMGLEVRKELGANINEIVDELEQGHKVIVGVNNMVLSDARFAYLPGYSANHAVEVIGVDYSDSKNARVILNDSGVPDGQGRTVHLDTFMKAWDTSGNFMASAWKGATV